MKRRLLLSFFTIWLCFKSNNMNAEAFAYPQAKIKILEIDSLYIKGFGDKLLYSFYKSHGNKTAWLENKSTRDFLLSALNSCAADGLNPKEFALEKLNSYEMRMDSLSDNDLVDYDIELTLRLQKYVSQLSNGRLNPKHLYRDWDLKENKTDINKIVSDFEKGDSLAEKAERLKPQHLIYKCLKAALKLLNTYPTDTISCIQTKDLISKGMSNPAIPIIKQKLIYWKDLNQETNMDSLYNEETYLAVKKFQQRHGLFADGVIGYRTVEALNFSKNRRREQIIANLERWKWFPRNPGNHYFIINIPEYNLKIIKNKDTIETKRVVVGLLTRKTAVLSSTFNTIILNPTWTIPPTILEHDIVPSAIKKSTYFSSKNITIYDSKNNVVAPANWNSEKYKNYRYVQSPGDDNSLGNVKFNFPNHYSVYLHDTNHKEYFVKTFRSLSSGCVRVENPLPLAQYMLNDKKWTMEKICEVIATKKTTGLPLKEKINVHQLYWTAWMDQDGTLQFLTDIYNLDDELYEKLGN